MTTVLEALNGALLRSLESCRQVYFIGEDVLDPYGGAFKVARGLSTRFPDRVLTTPVSEAGIIGLGVGMALRGLRPVVEIMFGDFLALGADQIINGAAKYRWMTGDQARVPMVIRTPMGGRRGYGPTHSQTLEKHFLGVPGLRVVAVSALDDPGELLAAAILEDDDPVLFIEHKLLYPMPVRPLHEEGEWVGERLAARYPVYRLRLAAAPHPRLTIATYGHMADLALEAAQRLAYRHEILAEIVVYTQLSPLVLDPLMASLSHTRRLLTAEEGTGPWGWGAEVVAGCGLPGSPLLWRRVAARHLPIPGARTLEEAVLPGVEDIVREAKALAEDRGGWLGG
jgi:pyruvate/2-oxoglutarate/acetoin dehydrogenase E1 component